MKFKIGQEVYVVDPFFFHIWKVVIVDTIDSFYIDSDMAYYEEGTVFETINEAKQNAHERLDAFYCEKRQIIDHYEGE